MRHFTVPFLALYLFAGTLRAAESQKFSPAELEVLKVRNELRETALRRDMTTWSRLVAEDCIFSTDDGTLITKAQFIKHIGKLPPEYDRSMNPRDYVIHLYGTTAIINFRLTGHEQFTDADIVSEMRQTETYVKQNGSWLLVARHWNNLPVNFRKPIVVDTSVYRDYAGVYEWRPGDDLETVSVKDGKLWSRIGNDSQIGIDEDVYLPLAADTFFVKSDLGTAVFARDLQGRVTGYTYHRVDGQEIHVRKIK
ncbi:MAG TPA: DUF4440 domain-containing protein [Terriglobales bacterium]|nr:DUF4440 domain-containing protein [Terriglobales bacterium]